MTICERIFKIIDEKKLKTSDLAKKIGIGQSVISNWKKRNTNPPIEYALVICEFLEISIEELITGEPGKSLTIEEQKLIDLYRKADEKGKEAILSTSKIFSPEPELETLSTSRTG